MFSLQSHGTYHKYTVPGGTLHRDWNVNGTPCSSAGHSLCDPAPGANVGQGISIERLLVPYFSKYVVHEPVTSTASEALFKIQKLRPYPITVNQQSDFSKIW